MIPNRYLEALKRLLRAEAYTRAPQDTKKPEAKPPATEGKSGR
jgi:hypothetical protein